MTYLTVPIQGRTKEEFEERLAAAARAGAEMVELRTDYLADLSPKIVAELVQAGRRTKLPIIVTCRDDKQGGVGNWSSKQRTEVLLEAINAGADFIDCEFDNFTAEVQTNIEKAIADHPKCHLILSAHNFHGPFEDAARLYEAIVTVCQYAIPKIVYTAGHISDCFSAFDLLHDKDRDAIVLCMGPAGMVSRILAKKFGSFLTFASLEDQQATAPGQFTIRQAKEMYRWDAITDQTEVFGVIGDPVGHSISPVVYNACFEKANLDVLYLPFLVGRDRVGFDLFMKGVVQRPWLNFGGFSVTIPHKTNALAFAGHDGDYVEPLAVTIGAVNTLKVGFNGIVTAYNTDYAGAMDALTTTMGIERHQLHGCKAACIGAGGVARAVVAGLVDAGAEVAIYNRTLPKAQHLAEEFRCRACGLEELSSLDAAIIINCTSIGMTPNVDASPVPPEVFASDKIAFDTVYTPLHTRFLKQAQAAGAKIVTGAEMFIRQAMAQYKIFVGTEPDEPTIRNVVSDKLASR